MSWGDESSNRSFVVAVQVHVLGGLLYVESGETWLVGGSLVGRGQVLEGELVIYGDGGMTKGLGSRGEEGQDI